MTLIITLSNSAGVLDTKTAKDGEEATRILADMVLGCYELHHGDKFSVVDMFDEPNSNNLPDFQ